MDTRLQRTLSRMFSSEFEDVNKLELGPFIAVIRMMKVELGQTQPELFTMILAVLYDYNPALGIPHYNKTKRYLNLALKNSPELADYLISILPPPVGADGCYNESAHSLHRLQCNVDKSAQNADIFRKSFMRNPTESTFGQTKGMLEKCKTENIAKKDSGDKAYDRNTNVSIAAEDKVEIKARSGGRSNEDGSGVLLRGNNIANSTSEVIKTILRAPVIKSTDRATGTLSRSLGMLPIAPYVRPQYTRAQGLYQLYPQPVPAPAAYRYGALASHSSRIQSGAVEQPATMASVMVTQANCGPQVSVGITQSQAPPRPFTRQQKNKATKTEYGKSPKSEFARVAKYADENCSRNRFPYSQEMVLKNGEKLLLGRGAWGENIVLQPTKPAEQYKMPSEHSSADISPLLSLKDFVENSFTNEKDNTKPKSTLQGGKTKPGLDVRVQHSEMERVQHSEMEKVQHSEMEKHTKREIAEDELQGRVDSVDVTHFFQSEDYQRPSADREDIQYGGDFLDQIQIPLNTDSPNVEIVPDLWNQTGEFTVDTDFQDENTSTNGLSEETEKISISLESDDYDMESPVDTESKDGEKDGSFDSGQEGSGETSSMDLNEDLVKEAWMKTVDEDIGQGSNIKVRGRRSPPEGSPRENMREEDAEISDTTQSESNAPGRGTDGGSFLGRLTKHPTPPNYQDPWGLGKPKERKKWKYYSGSRPRKRKRVN